MVGVKIFFIGILTILFHFMTINAGLLPFDYYNNQSSSNSNNGSLLSNGFGSTLSNSISSLRDRLGGSGGGIFSGLFGNRTGLNNSNDNTNSNSNSNTNTASNNNNSNRNTGASSNNNGSVSTSNATKNKNNNSNKNTGATSNSNGSVATSNTTKNKGRTHDPVLFIHGMNSIASVFNPHINYLTRQGWDRNSLYSVDLPDKVGFGPINAKVISSAADKLLQRTGAKKLDIVCHSMGGANTMNYILNGGGSNKVKKVITLGGANKLVTSAAPRGIDVTTISSSSDAIVNPLLSKLSGANNIVISGVTHVGLLSSPQVQKLLKENL
ncbi:alpha/beta-hydrolase [Neocallimastix lanati (nom. inval.)]|jgi:triacylglycerol esterase/lipase EstA (alpha/beta hydrolase family)|uniref:Alpha/beta-hydrolase n=1 Tax=Neocallimastix californiae TaxID=1754190 RepID=A0A1Y2BZY0_9FUNG|nr:alpha/beta-hydrolase [Neocallimastix sp. JGI-2020a]ORY40286.1 alpha/beta-hydrolase [Neocallimastix californiae]|eukprot:ORY40286.1 alpha/beta-hydrolase [Neocallimastix californiae]